MKTVSIISSKDITVPHCDFNTIVHNVRDIPIKNPNTPLLNSDIIYIDDMLAAPTDEIKAVTSNLPTIYRLPDTLSFDAITSLFSKNVLDNLSYYDAIICHSQELASKIACIPGIGNRQIHLDNGSEFKIDELIQKINFSNNFEYLEGIKVEPRIYKSLTQSFSRFIELSIKQKSNSYASFTRDEDLSGVTSDVKNFLFEESEKSVINCTHIVAVTDVSELRLDFNSVSGSDLVLLVPNNLSKSINSILAEISNRYKLFSRVSLFGSHTSRNCSIPTHYFLNLQFAREVLH